MIFVSLLGNIWGSDTFIVSDDTSRVVKKTMRRIELHQRRDNILDVRDQKEAYSDSIIMAYRAEIKDIKKVRKPHKFGYNSALTFETSQGSVISQKDFFNGVNMLGKPIKYQSSYDFKYSFGAQDFTLASEVFGSPYQGIGVRYMDFRNKDEIGTPWGVYLFQGARIASISSKVSFDYEWNFGITSGWKPYDYSTNPYNNIVGSKNNAYLGISLFGRWMISRHFDLKFGVVGSHYSNGNTRTPNEGVNTLAAVVGFKYYFNRDTRFYIKDNTIEIPKYPRHLEHELLLHGAVKSCAIASGELPEDAERAFRSKRFATFGITYAPMFALGYKFRVGPSFDLMYDETSGMQYNYDGYRVRFNRAPFNDQVSVGIAAKGDFVMPYFTLSLSLGYDFVSLKNQKTNFYQILALKINVTRDIFFNIGYKATQFSIPNNLMLGIGVRFNKYR